MARAAATASGLPPKVEIELAPRQFMISARATTPPRAKPLAMPLAKVMMSGVMPCAWKPQKCSPVRPHPVCTSSETNRIPRRSSTSFRAPYMPSGGVAKPPTPWMGSAIRQATSPAVAVSNRPSRSATQAVMYSASERWEKGLRSL